MSIAGDLHKNKHFMSIFWIIFGMIAFAMSSIRIFSFNKEDNTLIYIQCAINAVLMISFCIKEVKILNYLAITRLLRDGLKWVSRNGVIVYIGHLCLYKLIQMTNRNGSFDHILDKKQDEFIFI